MNFKVWKEVKVIAEVLRIDNRTQEKTKYLLTENKRVYKVDDKGAITIQDIDELIKLTYLDDENEVEYWMREVQ